MCTYRAHMSEKCAAKMCRAPSALLISKTNMANARILHRGSNATFFAPICVGGNAHFSIHVGGNANFSVFRY